MKSSNTPERLNDRSNYPIRPHAGTNRLLSAFCLATLCALATAATAADRVLVSPESASNPTGPWTAYPLSFPHLMPDGRLLLPVEGDHEFWRLKVTTADKIGFSLGLPLINVPPSITKIARDFLAVYAESSVGDPVGEPAVGDPFVGDPTGGDPSTAWRKVRLADTVIPVYDAAIDEGRTPAYYEFKVIADEPAPTTGGFRTTDGPATRDRGFILVSLTENDSPVAGWSTEGETRIEELRRKAGTSLIKPMSYGSALLIAEDPAGEARATDGSVLFRPSPELLANADHVGSSSGESLTGVSNRTPDLEIRTPFQPYASYREMKEDYRTNEFYKVSRERQAAEARLPWMIAKGMFPAEFRVQAGQTITLLAGRDVEKAHLETPDENAQIAQLTPLGKEGLRVDGIVPGSGVLRVQVDGREELFTLLVTPALGAEPGFTLAGAGGFTPGWRIYKSYSAGGSSAQRWYHQNQSLDYGGGGEGNKVGCGPCAWTMLMGWWDLKGVPVAFRPFYYGEGLPSFELGIPDAPAENDVYVESMMRDFRRNWVDPLYCNDITGQCGTPPDRMANGVNYFKGLRFLYNLVYDPLLPQDVLGYGYHIKWTYFAKNGVNEFNTLARESVRDGFPSIMGIGHLVHYVVAYSYLEQRFELLPGYYPLSRAWFRVNWGNGKSAYFNFNDNYFFATKIQFWQSTTNYVAP